MHLRNIFVCVINDKGDLKGFQTNFETLFLPVSVTVRHLSIREGVRKETKKK